MFATVTRMPYIRGLAKYEVLFSSTTNKWFQILRNSSSGLKAFELHKRDMKEVPEEITFSGFLQHKREQARRSIVFQIDNKTKWQTVFNFCSSIGEVKKMYHYETPQGNFIMIEMKSKEELKQIVETSFSDQNVIHHFALFDTSSFNTTRMLNTLDITKIKLNVEHTVKVEQVLKSAADLKCGISGKISDLCEQLKLDDFCMRLRFLTCLQIECLLGGLMRNSSVYPFGSSISGFGFKGCDLDLVVLEQSMNNYQDKTSFMCFPAKYPKIDRSLMQLHLEVLSNLIQQFLVGSKHVKCIKYARVPIIKFRHYFSSLECDLSLYVPSGVVMTQLLYALCSLDERVRPLVSVVRVWAKKLSLTSMHPGPHITNFSLTLLVIFFLQQTIHNKGAVLPSLNSFPFKQQTLMTVNEELSVINNFKMVTKSNDISLEQLLILFFSFYSSFNFSVNGCCVYTGKTISNTEGYSLYIKNPLDNSQNVSKNVNSTELSKFQNYTLCAKEILTNTKSTPIPENLIFNELFSIKNYRLDLIKESKKKSKISLHKIFSG